MIQESRKVKENIYCQEQGLHTLFNGNCWQNWCCFYIKANRNCTSRCQNTDGNSCCLRHLDVSILAVRGACRESKRVKCSYSKRSREKESLFISL